MGVAVLTIMASACGVPGASPFARRSTSATTAPNGSVRTTRLRACRTTAASVSGPTPLSASDPIEVATSNALAPLPVPGLADRTVVNTVVLADPEAYLNDAVIPDPQARLAVMQRDGFRGGVEVDYRSGSDKYGVFVLRFGSPDAALDYTHAHLADVCTLTQAMGRLPGLAGVSYLRDDNLAKAVFVAGDTEFSLDICTCVEASHRVVLAANWAVAIARQLAT